MEEFTRFFRPRPAQVEPDPEEELVHLASEMLEFSSTAYYPKLLSWLETEANRPLKIGDHMAMIQSAVRANTLKEIRDTLVRRVDRARVAMTEDRE